MTHALTPPDPIHAAVSRHRAAYDAFQVAEDGIANIEANDEYEAAGEALIATACTTRFGALALLGHLRWWLDAEAEFAAGYQPTYRLAEVRAADLTLFLGTGLPPVAIPRAAPCGRLTSPSRVLDHLGEAIAALVLIVGGTVLTALATLV